MCTTVSQIDASKHQLRRDILAMRFQLPEGECQEAAILLAQRALELPELASARTVAAYVSVGREPGTRPLLDALRARGTHVLLPVLMPDNDLDWGGYEGPETLERAGRGLLEPSGPRYGPDAVTQADVVLLPGLAVDGQGMRMGRGGGSYDRVLARIEAGVRAGSSPVLAVLLYDHEVLGEVPAEPHDRPVQAAVTPSKVHRFTDNRSAH